MSRSVHHIVRDRTRIPNVSQAFRSVVLGEIVLHRRNAVNRRVVANFATRINTDDQAAKCCAMHEWLQ